MSKYKRQKIICVCHCAWEGRARLWSLQNLLLQALHGCVNPHRPRLWLKGKFKKLLCKATWCH